MTKQELEKLFEHWCSWLCDFPKYDQAPCSCDRKRKAKIRKIKNLLRQAEQRGYEKKWGLTKELPHISKIEEKLGETMTNLTDQQVITECVKIAQENGWEYDLETVNNATTWISSKGKQGQFTTKQLTVKCDQLLFDHDFCKALFGEEEVCGNCARNNKECRCILTGEYYKPYMCSVPAWQYHIQQLALADGRIDYLRTWLDDKTKSN